LVPKDQLDKSTNQLWSAASIVLEASNYGCYIWIGNKDEAGRCSRRLSIILDLKNGLDSNFQDVLNGFDEKSSQELKNSMKDLKKKGLSFSIKLFHQSTKRYINANGFMELDSLNSINFYIIWMNDITNNEIETESLKTEIKELEIKNNLLQNTLDSLPIPIWVRDENLDLIYFNQSYIKIASPEDKNNLDKVEREIIPSISIKKAKDLSLKAKSSGTSQSERFHLIIDGGRKLLEIQENPIISDKQTKSNKKNHLEKNPLTIGIAKDITDQEKIEDSLKKEKNINAGVLEGLRTAIAIFDIHQNIVFNNSAYRELWNLEKSWLQKKPTYGEIIELLREQRRLPEVADFPSFKDKELELFHSQTEILEDVMHIPEGIILLRVISPHPIGGLIMTYEDVTDTLIMERSYKEKIKINNEAINCIDMGISIINSEGKIETINDAFLEIIDASREDLKKKNNLKDLIKIISDKLADKHNIKNYHKFIDSILGQNVIIKKEYTNTFLLNDNSEIEVKFKFLSESGIVISCTNNKKIFDS